MRFSRIELDESEKKRLLDDHLTNLRHKRESEFIALLRQYDGRLTFQSTFEHLSSIVNKIDPRWIRMENDDRRKEVFAIFLQELIEKVRFLLSFNSVALLLWLTFLRDQMKVAFRELMRSVTTITSNVSGPQFERALDILSQDARWKALDDLPEVRIDLVQEYIDSRRRK